MRTGDTMKLGSVVLTVAQIAVLSLALCVPIHAAREAKLKPKEFGVYIKTYGGLKRLIPNIVFDEGGILYVEMNNPPTFLLKDVQCFVVYGKYDMSVLTFNPMVFRQASPVGKLRFIFGKALEFSSSRRGTDLYVIKPQDLLGRGYFSLWINDSAWDFVID